ncbi:hypothetical protein AB0M10_15925 [Streptomyces sp. NPDC051840]|uniref:hypothetical protein n=1 Tax=unclassified Streptomyces TaxID=2593676 RepID=UPI00341B0652
MILDHAPGWARPAGWNKVTQPCRRLPQSGVDRIAQGGVEADNDRVRVAQK